MALRLVAYAVMGALFLSLACYTVSAVVEWKSRSDFFKNAQKLAERINILADQGAGSSLRLEIQIPQNCALVVENYEMTAICGGENKTFELKMALPPLTIEPGRHLIFVAKTGEGGRLYVQ